MSVPHQWLSGKLVWVWWACGSMRPQGTRVMLRKENTKQAVKTLLTSIEEKRIPRAKATCIPFTKRNKCIVSVGIRWVTSSSPCLILLMRVERSLLESSSSASKFVSILDRMSMKLHSKLGDLVSVKPTPTRGGMKGNGMEGDLT
eukprot:1156108-Pelagomonas_calceolata.AAC.11